jgi:SAM-dependent methyltransferase
MQTQRRLVFGQVAELYDRSRPTYPAALIDDLIALSGVGATLRALEVGAGTGKATRLMGERGVGVVAIEPSPEMAAVARRTCAGYPGVEIVESDFETWDPRGERFRLLYSAQAWHWIDPATGYDRAREALAGGGCLAPFWNRPAWGQSPLRRALSDAYRATVPDMPTDGPLHPDNTGIVDEVEFREAIDAAGGFTDAEVRRYHWTLEYSAAGYADLLATLSETRLLEPGTRERLLTAVRDTIAGHGGRLEMAMETVLGLARVA